MPSGVAFSWFPPRLEAWVSTWWEQTESLFLTHHGIPLMTLNRYSGCTDLARRSQAIFTVLLHRWVLKAYFSCYELPVSRDHESLMYKYLQILSGLVYKQSLTTCRSLYCIMMNVMTKKYWNSARTCMIVIQMICIVADEVWNFLFRLWIEYRPRM